MKNKFKILLPLILGILGVFATAISTFAWFQINQAPIQTSMVTGSPNVAVDNGGVYGYKINQGLGDTGFIDYGSDDVAKFASSGIEETNHHQDDEDINFDVPSDGIGYYLVKKNPGGTFKYKYTADGSTYTSYYTKFIEYDATYLTRAYIGSYTIAANDEFRVMHYTFANSKTVNNQIKIATAYGGSATVDDDSGDVKVATAGTYKVWLDYTSNDLSFESVSVTSQNVQVRALPKRAYTGSGDKTVTQINVYDNVQWGFRSIKIDNVNYQSGYGETQLLAFLLSYYGKDLSSSGWSNEGSTSSYKGYKKEGTAYFMCNGVSNNASTAYSYPLPSWINYCQVYILNNSNAYNIGYTNNIKHYSNNDSDHTPGDCYGKHIDATCYNWGAECSKSTSATKNWGQVDVTLTGYNSQTGSSLGSVGSFSVSRFYFLNASDIPDGADKDGYDFVSGWYTNTTRTTSYSNTFMTAGSLSTHGTLNLYCNYNPIYSVTLYVSYFIMNKNGTETHSNIPSYQISSNTYNAGISYTPASYTETHYKNDDTNGIYYKFNRSGTTTWYTNENCTSTYTNGSTLNSSKTLYAKYVADPRTNSTTHKIFYVDITHSYAYSSGVRQDGSYWSGVQFRGTNGTTKFVDAAKVATGLYRLTVPTSFDFKLGNASNTANYHDTTGQVNSSNVTTSNVSILSLENCDTGNVHGTHWAEPLSTVTYGTATIKVSTNGSTWKDPLTGSTSAFTTTMEYGDGSANNYFIYEHGIQIPSGYYIDIVVNGSSVVANTSYGKVSNGKYYNPGDRPYINTSGTYLKTAAYSDTARFNFYITGSGQLSIAMVPDLGNGFYIMPYNNGYGTNNFIGSIKMTTNGERKATYDGFYIRTANEKYYIRSYLDAVDVKYVSLSDSSDNVSIQTNSAASDYGVLTFASTGYYSIVVQNNTIYTSSYDIDTSFKLNKLDTSSVTYARDIWQQKTSLVLEVPFTCDNTYTSTISLNVQNSLNDFVGVSLYVAKPFSTATAYSVGDACLYGGSLYVFTSAHSAGSWNAGHVSVTDPYHFMRGTNANNRSSIYNSLSKNTEISDKANAAVKNSDSTCYAYILIDYLPTNTNAANTPSGNSAYSGSTCTNSIYSNANFITNWLNRNLSFYLVAEQV